MRFKVKGHVTDIEGDAFWGEMDDEDAGTISIAEFSKKDLAESEREYLQEGAFFTYYSDKGIRFSREVYTKEDLEKIKAEAKRLFDWFNEITPIPDLKT